jgi:hypothetical protein
MAEAAEERYEETKRTEVPSWILHFALESLLLNLPCQSSAVVDRPMIVTMDLDCDVSDITTANEGCVQTGWIYFCLTQN